MGWFDFITRVRAMNNTQDSYSDLTAMMEYDVQSIGNIVIPEKLTDANAYLLANSVSELFFPVDFYADRISKLPFYIGDLEGNPAKTKQYDRLIEEINPLFKFSDLIYQYVFSYLADGNAVTLRQKPSTYSGLLTVNNITRVDVLQPGTFTIEEFSNINPLMVSDLTTLIKQAVIYYGTKDSNITDVSLLNIDNYSGKRRSNSMIFAKSPLFAANKSIDTLMSVYSARYNVYANNGAGGYLVRKTSGNNSSIEAIADPVTRQKILDDINSRNGLTGRRNLWGISAVPLEFVKTIATISELLPLEETLEASVKIASVFQIPPVLVPRKDQSTFDNQASAERNVWENGLLSMVETVCENWTKILKLDTVNYKVWADTSSVSALVTNDISREELLSKQVANYKPLFDSGIITYNDMLIGIGKEPVESGDVKIYDMNKTPYAVKLGVGGTQALQAIIADPNINPVTKRNTLVVIFGLTEEEADKIMMTNGKEQ